jgi:hypothetical protein
MLTACAAAGLFHIDVGHQTFKRAALPLRLFLHAAGGI